MTDHELENVLAAIDEAIDAGQVAIRDAASLYAGLAAHGGRISQVELSNKRKLCAERGERLEQIRRITRAKFERSK